MTWFALGILIAWPVVVLFIFERQPLQQAIVTSFVAAWLFLPPIIIPLPGIPDWSKSSATTVGTVLALLLKRPDRVLGFRPRWFDWPVLGFCACSFASALSMGMGAYEGLSSVLEDLVRWGGPYLIGRIYLADAAGARCLSTGIAVGGLLYIPLCLIEIRLAPMLKGLVYGIVETNNTVFGLRYGGYRPTVFLTTGLEVGWWMCCATLCAYLLVAGRSTRRWFGLPATPLAWGLAAVTVACKSTGALVQMFLGLAAIWATRLGKNALPLWSVLLIAPAYCAARSSGYCSGEQISGVLRRFFDADRIQSMDFRFYMEDYLINAALQHPILGWTRGGGFNPIDEFGRSAAITDGYWIIVFCSTGAIGLTLLNVMTLLPSALFLRRYRVRDWLTPEVAPLLALAIILPLYMIDNLSNAMLNPIYAIAMGLVSGCSPGDADAGGRIGGRATGIEARAEAEEAALSEAIARQEQLVRGRPFVRNIEQLAELRAAHARVLTTLGVIDLALAERSAAEELWRSVESSSGGPRGETSGRADNANDLAWLLAAPRDVDPNRLERARLLAEWAVSSDPGQSPHWNTLGVVLYRLGEHHRSIQALGRSVALHPDGGTAFDFYFLALANRALGYEQLATTWLDRAEAWTLAGPIEGHALWAVRAEAVGHAEQT